MTKKMDLLIAELKEFAGFQPKEQRYIKRSIDVAFGESNPVREWARSHDEEYSIRAQHALYEKLAALRALANKSFSLNLIPELMPDLISITAFDLNQGSLYSFSAYRFLYERLLGARVRQWLPSAFCGAAALPHLSPDRRKILLQSISESAATAPGWSEKGPFFFPKWVEKDQ